MTGRHLFVCTNARSAGKPACGPRGGDALVAAVQRELLVRKATDVLVTPCGCLGPCFDGPNAVVYPDGVWYAELEAKDAGPLAEHLIGGAALAAKVSTRPGSVQEEPVLGHAGHAGHGGHAGDAPDPVDPVGPAGSPGTPREPGSA